MAKKDFLVSSRMMDLKENSPDYTTAQRRLLRDEAKTLLDHFFSFFFLVSDFSNMGNKENLAANIKVVEYTDL